MPGHGRCVNHRHLDLPRSPKKSSSDGHFYVAGSRFGRKADGPRPMRKGDPAGQLRKGQDLRRGGQRGRGSPSQEGSEHRSGTSVSDPLVSAWVPLSLGPPWQPGRHPAVAATPGPTGAAPQRPHTGPHTEGRPEPRSPVSRRVPGPQKKRTRGWGNHGSGAALEVWVFGGGEQPLKRLCCIGGRSTTLGNRFRLQTIHHAPRRCRFGFAFFLHEDRWRAEKPMQSRYFDPSSARSFSGPPGFR